ncbi:hypothetical protein U9M48_044745 [Paspalum notatum var. saurae]|uniref:Uncharacterized protein n=1 Tax=Paspalum notatum var. saurae TaxID=547442 RepID=A0AAQ3UVP6_PASNO
MPKRRLTITVILGKLQRQHKYTVEMLWESYSSTSLHPPQMQRHSRRLLTEIQDYDYGGSNSKHDPRRKPGNGH